MKPLMKPVVRRLIPILAVLGAALAMPLSASAAPTAPAATTGPASQITTDSAVLSGSVSPNGLATTYVFQYGPTASYGSETTATAAGAGTSATVVHATIGGLISNSTYHYRIVATNSSGTTAGADETVTTSKAPPTATITSPSVVTSTSAVVNGTVDPNGKPTTYVVEYGPSASYGLQTATVSVGSGTDTVAVHATVNGLNSGTTYHYRVAATNADGTTVTPDATLITTGHAVNPAGPLPAVSEASAVAVSTHTVQLNGAINPQGPTTTWYFQVGLTTAYGLQTTTETISGLGARPINVRLSGLQSGSTYHFRLVACSANGLYVGPDHVFKTKYAAREHVAGFAVYGSARRGDGTVTMAVHGRVLVPAGLSRNAVCNGPLSLEFREHGATVALRHTQLRPNCTYRLTAHIAADRLRGSGSLEVVAYFWGNAELSPSTHRQWLHVHS